MQLQWLGGREVVVPQGCGEIAIAGLTADSRQVRPGWVFAALAGSKTDGQRFIAEAVAKGAAAILVTAGAQIGHAAAATPVLSAAEPRRALAMMAKRFYGAEPATVLAVTGTSGKTSVVDFTRQILSALGRSTASLGTLGLITADGEAYGALTTPDPVTLHKILADLAATGVTHLALEASSHGLDQFRLDGVAIRAAAFTNLGRDHLDYHADMDAYLGAKLRLFGELLVPDGTAVVNTDASEAGLVIAAARRRGAKVMGVGKTGDTLTLEGLAPNGFAQAMRVRHAGRTSELRLPLLGAYQAANALLAAGLAIAVGEAPQDVLPALQQLKGVKGRLEIVGEAHGGLVVIDYAHKPDALAAALDALRPFAPGKLICVLGCGGDRDKGKRPIMGRIASEKANIVIVTDDNPRSEAPEAIRAEILAGAPGAREIGDRAEAIRAGVRRLAKGDALLVAGKGHETGQIVMSTVIAFSDHDAVRAAMAEARVHG
jgi:UDP-N-acetylmuramoyl-L-alanyl-D-glutamate--2,6-diaminopimelate ligase